VASSPSDSQSAMSPAPMRIGSPVGPVSAVGEGATDGPFDAPAGADPAGADADGPIAGAVGEAPGARPTTPLSPTRTSRVATKATAPSSTWRPAVHRSMRWRA
jgi:hypothetical protein